MFIPDPGSRIQVFPSRIKDPGSQRHRVPNPDPQQRILSILNPKCVTRPSEILAEIFIPFPDFFLFHIPGSKKHRILDPQPWYKVKKIPTLINILPHLFPVRLRSPLPPALALLWESSCRTPFPVPDSLGRETSSSPASGGPAASGTRRRGAAPCGGT
jgi:hypothetical protein